MLWRKIFLMKLCSGHDPKNLNTRYISSKALVNKDKDGKPVSMTGVCFDVTGLKEGTEQLVSKLNEELLRSNKDLESFAYVASHDLAGTPQDGYKFYTIS